VDKSHLRLISLFFLAFCTGLYFYTDSQQQYYDNSAKLITADMLMEISSWQREPLLKHLSIDAQKTLTNQQLEKLLDHYQQQFGQLKSIDNLQFSRIASALSLFGSKRINYQTNATFSNGRAHINITLVVVDNSFKIYNFTISRLT
jgi:hypothetical protein